MSRQFGAKVGAKVVFYLVKIEPRLIVDTSLLTRSLRAPPLAVGEDVRARWMMIDADVVMVGGARIAASSSMGVRPLNAIEKRS